MTTTPARLPEPATSIVPGATGQPRPRSSGYRLPAYAGITYVVVWVAGLAVWPQNLPLNAPPTQVAASYAAHPAAAVIQYLLVEGLAGLLFGVVLGFALISAGDRPAVRNRLVAATALAAVLVSLLQAILGMFLVAAATQHDVARAGNLSDLVNRLDGVKMLALAAVAAYLAARGTAGRTPSWLRAVAALAAAALTVSGLGYLTLSGSLGWAAYVSGPLLLLWVAATGMWLTRRSSAAAISCGTA
jgi:hypothetical protein